MPEVEDLIIDAARRAVTAAGRLLARPASSSPDGLEQHQDRLRVLVAAVCGRPLELLPAQPPARPTLLHRLLAGDGLAGRERRALPATDGRRIWLPTQAPPCPDLSPARFYRTVALHHAIRVQLPPHSFPSLLARELYLLAEAARAERRLIARLPRIAPDFVSLRRLCLDHRPASTRLTPCEREVEHIYRQLLGSDAARILSQPDGESPLTWAMRVSQEWGGSAYRGLLPCWWLGALQPPPVIATATPQPAGGEQAATRPGRGRLARTPRGRIAADEEDDREPGLWMIQTSEPMQHVEDAHGLQRPADQGSADADELADSLSELPELRVVRSHAPVQEVLAADGQPQTTGGGLASPTATRHCYPEWDWRQKAYRHPGAWVEERPPPEGDEGWAERVFAAHPALAARLRRQFERLRPQRLRLCGQPEGDELDLDACVRAAVEQRAGTAPGQRLHIDRRPLRRELALMLLLDVSGSTEAWVGGTRRVIDVARESLLLVSLALERLALPHAILAFSGDTPGRATVWPVRSFDDRDPARTARRLAALDTERYTRAGAALRHATARLSSRHERRRVLLLLSDGRPYDADCYGGRYGIEDTRRAVIEASGRGIQSFCLTVDRQAPAYLPEIFGTHGYRLLRHPSELPEITARLVQAWMR